MDNIWIYAIIAVIIIVLLYMWKPGMFVMPKKDTFIATYGETRS